MMGGAMPSAREPEARSQMGEMKKGTDSVNFFLLFAGLSAGPRSFGKERTAQTDADSIAGVYGLLHIEKNKVLL
jgi:hypothetical protein